MKTSSQEILTARMKLCQRWAHLDGLLESIVNKMANFMLIVKRFALFRLGEYHDIHFDGEVKVFFQLLSKDNKG